MPDVDAVPLKRRALSPARLVLLAVVLALAGCGSEPEPVTSVTIVADPGRFGTIARAAAAEDSIDWWAIGDAPSAGDTAVATSPEEFQRREAVEREHRKPMLAAWRDRAACTASFAALELARFLPGAFGIPSDSVRVATPSEAPARGHVILVGEEAARLAGLDLNDGELHFWSTQKPERDLILIAAPGGPGTTLLGAYTLLERLGVRFYDLGDSNVAMPARPAAWPRALRWDQPAFATRGFWAWEPRGTTDFFLWMARNRMNLWTAAEPRAAFLEKLGIRLTAGGHGIESEFLDPNGRAPGETRTRFQLHPEWYGLENGKRTPGISGESGLNFCTSNHAAVAELARGLDENLRTGSMRHADVVELWPLDGGRWCQCDSCKAIGSPQDRWLRVAAEVRQQLKRPVTIVTPAYLETSTAPAQPVADAKASPNVVTFFPYFRCYAHALADPACTIVNAPIESRLRGWTERPSRPYKGELAIGEYYNVSWTKSLPFVHPHVMAADLRDWSERGITHFTTMHAPTRLWGTWTFEHAMLARLLWNPDANVDSLIGDFCVREYGDAGGDLRVFYRALELATANLTALQHAVGSIGFGESTRLLDTRVPIFRLKHLGDEPPPAIADSSTTLTGIETSLSAARAALDAGRARNHDPRVAARLAEVDARFRYGDAMLRFWIALIRAAEAAREDRAADLRTQIAVADSQAARLRAVTDLVQVAATHANASDGLAASGATRVYQQLREIAATAPR